MIQLAVADLLEAGELDLGTSEWHTIEQGTIDAFAGATGDDQWIHVEPARASTGPFAATVAHGYLLLSLLPFLFREMLEYSDKRASINYGLDRVRFTAPVRVGSRVRLHATLREATRRGGGILVRSAVELELEASEKPALVGEVLSLVFAET